MLIYNTTYHVEEGEDKNFLIWMQEHYLPEVEKNGTLYHTITTINVGKPITLSLKILSNSSFSFTPCS